MSRGAEEDIAMQKIPSIFERNFEGDRLVRHRPVPGTEWVFAGEGVATRKWDGTCCLIRGGKLYKRYEVRAHGTPPPGFEPATEADPVTGKQQGWVAVGDGPEDQYHRSAFARSADLWGDPLADGTYELCGPKVQGNPERLAQHVLVPHRSSNSAHVLTGVPREYEGLKAWLAGQDIEGVVFRHPDGRMAKVKKRDFGLKR